MSLSDLPSYARGTLVFDRLDRRLHRFVRWELDRFTGTYDAVLCDRNTGRELPDLRHPSQVLPAGAELVSSSQ
jgi:hypothetical protein